MAGGTGSIPGFRDPALPQDVAPNQQTRNNNQKGTGEKEKKIKHLDFPEAEYIGKYFPHTMLYLACHLIPEFVSYCS